MKKFWIRTASSVVYVALFLGTMLSGVILKNEIAGTVIFLAFLLFVACGCTFEFYRIAKMKGADKMVGICGGGAYCDNVCLLW